MYYYNDMEQYYIKFIEKGYTLAMYELALYYKENDNMPNMIKYLAMASIDTPKNIKTYDAECATFALEILCKEIYESPYFFKYLTIYQQQFIANHYINIYALGYDVPVTLLEDYYYEKSDYEKLEHVLLLREALENDNSEAMNDLGILYYNNCEYHLMAQFFGMAIAKNNYDAYENMSKFWKKRGNQERMIRYHVPKNTDTEIMLTSSEHLLSSKTPNATHCISPCVSPCVSPRIAPLIDNKLIENKLTTTNSCSMTTNSCSMFDLISYKLI